MAVLHLGDNSILGALTAVSLTPLIILQPFFPPSSCLLSFDKIKFIHPSISDLIHAVVVVGLVQRAEISHPYFCRISFIWFLSLATQLLLWLQPFFPSTSCYFLVLPFLLFPDIFFICRTYSNAQLCYIATKLTVPCYLFRRLLLSFLLIFLRLTHIMFVAADTIRPLRICRGNLTMSALVLQTPNRAYVTPTQLYDKYADKTL